MCFIWQRDKKGQLCKDSYASNIVHKRHRGAQSCFGAIVMAIFVSNFTRGGIGRLTIGRKCKSRWEVCFKPIQEVCFAKLEPMLVSVTQLFRKISTHEIKHVLLLYSDWITTFRYGQRKNCLFVAQQCQKKLEESSCFLQRHVPPRRVQFFVPRCFEQASLQDLGFPMPRNCLYVTSELSNTNILVRYLKDWGDRTLFLWRWHGFGRQIQKNAKALSFSQAEKPLNRRMVWEGPIQWPARSSASTPINFFFRSYLNDEVFCKLS